MDILTEFEPCKPAGPNSPSDGDALDAGILSRAVLGASGSSRFDLQMDLLASAWLGAVIAAIADPTAGVAFVAIGFVLTGLSARFGPPGRPSGDDLSRTR